MRAALLTPWLGRRGGGIAVVVHALGAALSDEGVEVSLHGVAADGEDVPMRSKRLPVHLARRYGPAAFGFAPGMQAALAAEAPDLVHAHGLWMYPSLASLSWSRRTRRPVVISPHGMLDPWAVGRSAWKKRLAGLLYEDAHLRRSACLHALCAAEAEALRGFGLDNPIAVIPNGVELPRAVRNDAAEPAVARPEGRRTLLFLGRIHPKKGLVQLLHAWAALSADLRHQPWRLVIAGWDQVGHLARLRRLADELGIRGTVQFAAAQFGDAKRATFAAADAFILPSLSEGLPMAVLEAWSYGLPVIMTPACNLPEGFEHRAALRTEADPEHLVEVLRHVLRMPTEDLRAIGRRGRALVEERFTWPRIGREMARVYAWALGDGPRPGCMLAG